MKHNNIDMADIAIGIVIVLISLYTLVIMISIIKEADVQSSEVKCLRNHYVWHDDNCLLGKELDCYKLCGDKYFYDSSGLFSSATCSCGGKR
jgi:hypothetical protein